jgi:carbon monoxide dehydrogenase subunit G
MGELQASHTVEIDAPLEQVYAVAADVQGAVEWQPSVVSIEVIETHPDGTAKLVELEADAVVKKAKSVLRYEYSPPGGISWVQEQGDTKSLTGEWVLTAIDEGSTRATYSLKADPGRMLGMLLRGPVEGKVKEFLTRGAAEGLKEHCESA